MIPSQVNWKIYLVVSLLKGYLNTSQVFYLWNWNFISSEDIFVLYEFFLINSNCERDNKKSSVNMWLVPL